LVGEPTEGRRRPLHRHCLYAALLSVRHAEGFRGRERGEPGDGQTGGVRGRWLVCVIGAAVVLFGCASGDGSPANAAASTRTEVVDSVPFLDGGSSGAGTTLRDGIRVVDGSRVLAGPIPQEYFLQPGDPDLDRGWTALAVVTGDVRRVLDAYAAQATKLGLKVPPVGCVDVPLAHAGAVPVTSCTARSQSADCKLVFRLDDTQSRGLPGFMPVSHVWITVKHLAKPFPYPEPDVSFGAPVTDPGRGSTLPWPTTLPGVGERFEPGTDTSPGFVVQPGTWLVGPPGVPVMSNSVDSAVAVLRVDGDVSTVVDGFRKQFKPGYENHRTSTQEGVRVERWYWTNGDTATVDVYRQTGQPTWMFVWHTAGD